MRPIRSLRRTKASKRGSCQPSRKISVVSSPPSVRNRPPPSCGSRSRYFACLATVFRSLSWGVGTSAVGGENGDLRATIQKTCGTGHRAPRLPNFRTFLAARLGGHSRGSAKDVFKCTRGTVLLAGRRLPHRCGPPVPLKCRGFFLVNAGNCLGRGAAAADQARVVLS